MFRENLDRVARYLMLTKTNVDKIGFYAINQFYHFSTRIHLEGTSTSTRFATQHYTIYCSDYDDDGRASGK